MRASRLFGWVCIALVLAGCDLNAPTRPASLVTGTVDTSAVFDSDPEYSALSKQYVEERVSLSKAYVKETRGKDAAGIAALQTKYGDQQKELDKKWMARTNDFVKARRSRLEGAAASICKDKGIDLVIIDGPRYRTVEWGGVEITQDIMVKLYGSKPVATPTGTPSAGGSK